MMSSGNEHQQQQQDIGDGRDDVDDDASSQMDDFSSVDFSMTEFNIKDGQSKSSKNDRDNQQDSSVLISTAALDIDDNKSATAASFSSESVIGKESCSLLGNNKSSCNNSNEMLEDIDKVKIKQMASKDAKIRKCSGDGMNCAECGKVFSHSFYFGTHISCHMSEKSYHPVGQCGMCGLVFADLDVYQAHMVSLQSRLDQMAVGNLNESVAEVSNGKLEEGYHQLEAQLEKTQQPQHKSGRRPSTNTSKKCKKEKEKLSEQQVLPLETNLSPESEQQHHQIKLRLPISSKNSNNNNNSIKNSSNSNITEVVESTKVDGLKRPAPSSSPPENAENGELPRKRVRRAPVKFECIPEVKKCRSIKKKPSLLSPSSSSSSLLSSSFLPPIADDGPSYSADYDPEVERYLQSLKDMGLTVDPDAFGVKGGGDGHRGKGASGPRLMNPGGSGRGSNLGKISVGDRGRVGPSDFNASRDRHRDNPSLIRGGVKDAGRAWDNDGDGNNDLIISQRSAQSRFHNNKNNNNMSMKNYHTPLGKGDMVSAYYHTPDYYSHRPQNFVRGIRKMSRDEEDEEVLTLITADLEVMPKSGKQTRGERLKQRQERLSQNGEEGSSTSARRSRLHYNPPKEEQKLKKSVKGRSKSLYSGGGGGSGGSNDYSKYLSKFNSNDNTKDSSSLYGASWKVNNKKPGSLSVGVVQDDDDDDVQIVGVEELSLSSHQSKPSMGKGVQNPDRHNHHQQHHNSKGQKVIGGPLNLSGDRKLISGPASSKNRNRATASTGGVRLVKNDASRKHSGKVINLEGDMQELRKKARKNVEDMLASPEIIFNNLHGRNGGGDISSHGDDGKEENSGPVPLSLEYCGDAVVVDQEEGIKVDEEVDWCVEERKSDEEEEEMKEGDGENENESEKGVKSSKVVEEKERGGDKGKDGEDEEKEEVGTVQEGEDIDGWTVSITAVSDSEEEEMEKDEEGKEAADEEEEDSKKKKKGREENLDGKDKNREKEKDEGDLQVDKVDEKGDRGKVDKRCGKDDKEKEEEDKWKGEETEHEQKRRYVMEDEDREKSTVDGEKKMEETVGEKKKMDKDEENAEKQIDGEEEGIVDEEEKGREMVGNEGEDNEESENGMLRGIRKDMGDEERGGKKEGEDGVDNKEEEERQEEEENIEGKKCKKENVLRETDGDLNDDKEDNYNFEALRSVEDEIVDKEEKEREKEENVEMEEENDKSETVKEAKEKNNRDKEEDGKNELVKEVAEGMNDEEKEEDKEIDEEGEKIEVTNEREVLEDIEGKD